jgi:nitrate reductase assembly molybdenum cofactor insertion protein NarJ
MIDEDVRRVATALQRPDGDYLDAIERVRSAIAARSGEGARQLGVFVDRVRDLSLEELDELHDETFRGALVEGPTVAARLAADPLPDTDARSSLQALTPMLERLDADRNPFAYVVRALCFLLLMRVAAGGPDDANGCR